MLATLAFDLAGTGCSTTGSGVQDFETLSYRVQCDLLVELAHQAIRLYALPHEPGVSLVNLSENATFRIDSAEGRRWALRIHRDGYHSHEAIASELAWLIDLRDSGVAVTPRPVQGLNGELIQRLGHARMKRPRHIVLFEWESGTEPGIAENLSQPFEQLGEVAARMHRHVRRWQRPHWFTRFTWDCETALGERQPHWGRWRDGMGVDRTRAALLGRTVAVIGRRLAAFGKGDRFGLIHGDLRLANLLVEAGTVKVIDFDDCGFGWFMYDAATPLSFHEDDAQVPALIESWVRGYRCVGALDQADVEEIPTFIMLRRLLLVAWIGSHSETALAQSMGLAYTEATDRLCESYLSRFG